MTDDTLREECEAFLAREYTEDDMERVVLDLLAFARAQQAKGLREAAEAVLQTVIKFDVDWLRTATKAEAITETLRQASAALRGKPGGG
jgi:hypothetical protein